MLLRIPKIDIESQVLPQIPYFLLACLVAAAWLFVSNSLYSYNKSYFAYDGINIFPLAMWLMGLFSFYFLYMVLEEKFLDRLHPSRSFVQRIALFTFLYWLFLLAVESFGYHVLDIRNMATSQYAGLPVCDCIHAPFWMQIAYFMMGPLYFILCELWKYLKN